MVASRNGAGAGAAAESRESGESVSPASAPPAASPLATNLRRVIDTMPPFPRRARKPREAGPGGRDAWTRVSDLDEARMLLHPGTGEHHDARHTWISGSQS